MDQDLLELAWYIIPFGLVFGLYGLTKRKRHKIDSESLQESQTAGLTEPASLHPKIDPIKCIGSRACVSACPEGNVIGIINGKAQLINPTKCIGHGACKLACPHDAISLVFGTEKRGIDIPDVGEDFQTNVPGIYIAGELGGMGLIRNAVNQGRQAMEYIIKNTPNLSKDPNLLDVVIIGAGPSGFSASLGALDKKLNFVTLEQDSLGGTVAQFPRGKIVMTAPVDLPIVGKMTFSETTKEALINFWQNIEKQTNIKINYLERMIDITKNAESFTVKTEKTEYKTKNILLAIGRRGTPRKLGVKGEDQMKVVYRLADPAQYQGQHVLIVGGGDSALEAATSIADEPNTTVSISYRNDAFGRAKQKNRDKVNLAEKENRLNVILPSTVKEIFEDSVALNQNNKEIILKNDAIIVCAGGILPTPLLKKIGIAVDTKHGTE